MSSHSVSFSRAARDQVGEDGVAQEQAGQRSDLAILTVAATVTLGLIWAAQLPSSLWIDELGTFWVIDGDLGSTIDRAWRFHGQTPLYYTLLWLSAQLLGTSEVALRLPSFAAMLAAAGLVYVLGRRFYGRWGGQLAFAVFLVLPGIGPRAGDARPYALALLTTLVATLVLVGLMDRPSGGRAIGYGLAAALIIYVHYVFAAVLIAHGIYFLSASTGRRRFSQARIWPHGVVAVATFVAAISPTIPQILNLLGRREELTFSSTARLLTVFEIWATPVISVIALSVLLWVISTDPGKLKALPKGPTTLVVLGLITPPLVLFGLAQLTDVVLWTPRYWMAALPFAALMFGGLISRALRTTRAATRLTLAVLLLGMLTGTSFEHSVENWRAAISFANARTAEDTPVLLYSNLIELSNPEFLIDREKRSYVSSPHAYYPIQGDIILMPWASPASDHPTLLAPRLDAVSQHDQVVFIANRSGGALQLSFVTGWFTAHGYELASFEEFGDVRVAEYARP